ncbi:hypothetical protein ACFQT0_04480 [Hymenobacter humi]|uniref:Uncharacterized protein n=1 Tax=Hymenobacter humi TaxID=1411620 RepID=A0ABW2U013_9BACT
MGGGGVALLAATATVASMQLRKAPAFDKIAAQFFRSRHYSVGFDAGAVHRGLALIPATARVSATSALVPHLAARPYIYQLPYVADADYIAALRQASTFPLSPAELEAQAAGYQASGHWQVVLAQGPLLILRRTRPLPQPTQRFSSAGRWGRAIPPADREPDSSGVSAISSLAPATNPFRP